MNMRKIFAVALLVLTLGLPGYADESGQMDTPRPKAVVVIQPQESGDPAQMTSGQMDTTLTAMLGVIESILALI